MRNLGAIHAWPSRAFRSRAPAPISAKALPVPLDDGCRFDQNHHLQATRPNSVEPTPKQAIATTKPRSAGPLPVENSHLMSQSQDFQFQRGPTPKPEGDQRNHCGQDRKHAGLRRSAQNSNVYGVYGIVSSDRLPGCTARKAVPTFVPRAQS